MEQGVVDVVRDIYGASIADEPEATQWWAKLLRYAATPAAAKQLASTWYSIDLRNVLPTIHVPTLVISRFNRDEAAFTASKIPGATLVELPFHDAQPWRGDQERVFSAIGDFLDSVRREQAAFDRALATVMFTDIVGSTATASEVGDRHWKELVEQHHAIVRGLLARYRGQEVDIAGDGFFATFDGPARAVQCARAIIRTMSPIGLEVRAGVHTGEVETINDKVGGIAVSIGARVGALAKPDEVLVSQTVKDLTAGSGLTFEDAGEHEIKGVPGSWRLYRAVSGW
jgi:class 3 adenylate cyclase